MTMRYVTIMLQFCCITICKSSLGRRPSVAKYWLRATAPQIEEEKYGLGYGRMANGGHGLPTDSPGPANAAMPYPTVPRGRATPETVIRPLLTWSARWAVSLPPSYTPSDTPRQTPMTEEEKYGAGNRNIKDAML
jgi:hypothetical protein